MTRRKGERPVAVTLDTWSPAHPVADAIGSGTYWFDAWVMQKATPIARLAKQTGISATRLLTISAGDRVSQAEVDARAWCISARDLVASLPEPTLIIP